LIGEEAVEDGEVSEKGDEGGLLALEGFAGSEEKSAVAAERAAGGGAVKRQRNVTGPKDGPPEGGKRERVIYRTWRLGWGQRGPESFKLARNPA
jgi:hypothetical protein